MSNRSSESDRPEPTPPHRTDELEAACLHAGSSFEFSGHPSTPPIVPTAVWECESPAQADAMLSGEQPGYVYQRDRHPNADWLADRIRDLHQAPFAAITSSGMAALAAILLAHARSGDRLAISNQLYGRSTLLMQQEAARLGMSPLVVDLFDSKARKSVWKKQPKLVLVETIANPRLRVADLSGLAQEAHDAGALLVVDNTFATPLVCQPLALGADVVYESLSKLMNGHGDLMLGAIASTQAAADRIASTISTWGLASSPFDCWLAQRGIGTLGLRVERACETALQLAVLASKHPAIRSVDYPGLAAHPDHELAKRLFLNGQSQVRFGHVVTLHLRSGASGANQLIREAKDFPFCPSLGELRTTLSHPASTSHRSLTSEARGELGIDEGTIRVSLGIEPTAWVVDRWNQVLDSLDRGEDTR